MNCPNCGSSQTFVVNSRSTKNEMQIWRRRLCVDCKQRFTTHETIDLSHLVVIKKSGKKERFSRVKLFSGIFWATHGVKLVNRQRTVDVITGGVEKEILGLKKKMVTSKEISEIVLRYLMKANVSVFLRFISYQKQLKTSRELKKEIQKYIN